MNKKAITPIIAVILLVMMTVAAAAASFFWLIKIQSQMQGGAEQYEEQVFERIASTVNWHDADYNSTGENLTIYLQNAGTTNIPLDNSTSDPTTSWILKDSNQVAICSTKWCGAAPSGCDGAVKCMVGCGGNLEQAELGSIALNLSASDCDIDSYSSNSLFYVDIFFSGKASTSGTFKS